MGSEAVLPPPGSGSRVQRAAQAVEGADRRTELCPPPQPTHCPPSGLSFCPFPPTCFAPTSSTCCSFPCRVHTMHRGSVCMRVCNSIKQNTMKSGRDAVRQQFPTLRAEPACALVTRGFACSSPRDPLLEVPIPHPLSHSTVWTWGCSSSYFQMLSLLHPSFPLIAAHRDPTKISSGAAVWAICSAFSTYSLPAFSLSPIICSYHKHDAL